MQLPVPKQLYPREFQHASRLEYYASMFNSIEINRSFYKVPLAQTIRKWSQSVQEEFRFTFKVWKEITHVKALDYKETDVQHFMNAVAQSGRNSGCLLLQFPPGLNSNYLYNLDGLLRSIKEKDAVNTWKLAVEFRNTSWYEETIYEVISEHNATIVIHDSKNAPSPFDKQSADVVYLRFHGPEGNYRGSYAESYIYEYAGYIINWLKEGRTVYAYFNNTAGDAFNNLHALNNTVSSMLQQ